MDKNQFFAIMFAASFSPQVLASLDIDEPCFKSETSGSSESRIDDKLFEFDRSSQDEKVQLYRDSIDPDRVESQVQTTVYHDQLVELRVSQFDNLDPESARQAYKDVVSGKVLINVVSTDPTRGC